MKYKVIPFVANVEANQDQTGEAAEQLSILVNAQAEQGWNYVRLESIETNVTDPGSGGCFGLGGTPPTYSVTRYDLAVFSKD